MSDEEFKQEVQDLVDMLNSFRRIKDKGRRKWLKKMLRDQLTMLIKD